MACWQICAATDDEAELTACKKTKERTGKESQDDALGIDSDVLCVANFGTPQLLGTEIGMQTQPKIEFRESALLSRILESKWVCECISKCGL